MACILQTGQLQQIAYSLYPPDVNQAAAYIPYRQEPSYIACILQKRTTCSLHSPDRNLIAACILQTVAPASIRQLLEPSDGSQVTAYILQTLAPASFS